MKSPEPPKVQPLDYSALRPRLNIFQKFSILAFRIAGILLLLNAFNDAADVVTSRTRGYDVSFVEIFDPGARYLVVGPLFLIFAKVLGAWLGSGLDKNDNA